MLFFIPMSWDGRVTCLFRLFRRNTSSFRSYRRLSVWLSDNGVYYRTGYPKMLSQVVSVFCRLSSWHAFLLLIGNCLALRTNAYFALKWSVSGCYTVYPCRPRKNCPDTIYGHSFASGIATPFFLINIQKTRDANPISPGLHPTFFSKFIM